MKLENIDGVFLLSFKDFGELFSKLNDLEELYNQKSEVTEYQTMKKYWQEESNEVQNIREELQKIVF